jgi:uncharacterized protein with PIN domain
MRFLCDHMLGTLAKWLRFLGYDTAYPEALGDNELKALAATEGRILLTRDRELSGRSPGAVYIESDDGDEQLVQVVRAFRLTANEALSRCSVCNIPIEVVPKEAVNGRVPAGVFDRQREFWRCRQCGRFYWRGSHFEKVLAKVREVAGEPSAD